MTAPHQDERIEGAVRLGVGLGVRAAADALHASDELRGHVAAGVEAGIRAVLAALGISPRVDVTAGPAASVTVVIHGDPGASPDTRPE